LAAGSRRSERGNLRRRLGALTRGGHPVTRGTREEGLSQLSLASTDDSDIRLGLFGHIYYQTLGSRDAKLVSDDQYDTMIREGSPMPCLHGSIVARIHPTTGADNARVSGSAPLSCQQKAAAVSAWVASSPANAKPAASPPLMVAFLLHNQHLIRAPIVTVLQF
jgi:hypothetical protein